MAIVTINDSMDEEILEQCQAAADARNSEVVFGGDVNDLVHNHLTLLHDAQSMPAVTTPSEDAIVKNTFVEEDSFGGESDVSTRSLEVIACAPEPNSHYNSDGGNEDDRGGVRSRRSALPVVVLRNHFL